MQCFADEMPIMTGDILYSAYEADPTCSVNSRTSFFNMTPTDDCTLSWFSLFNCVNDVVPPPPATFNTSIMMAHHVNFPNEAFFLTSFSESCDKPIFSTSVSRFDQCIVRNRFQATMYSNAILAPVSGWVRYRETIFWNTLCDARDVMYSSSQSVKGKCENGYSSSVEPIMPEFSNGFLMKYFLLNEHLLVYEFQYCSFLFMSSSYNRIFGTKSQCEGDERFTSATFTAFNVSYYGRKILSCSGRCILVHEPYCNVLQAVRRSIL
jgi:hypothetical protein